MPIKKISVKQISGFIDALRLTDVIGRHIVNVCWNTLMEDDVDWQTFEIPKG